ncbi:MAG TPA: glycosyltransferase [Candidatus Moranbacteria bacterium]|nr:glycosyltransferase [Candidatus Moranbacteria bacterium]
MKDFSIIIPCYNLGDLLPKAVKSAMKQTLENIEVIVVDDASPDKKTQKVLDEIEKEVKVIRLKENGGVSVARNAGIEASQGKYILCLDADDHIEPTYLEKAFNIFESDKNVGIVSCWLKSFGSTDAVWTPEDKVEIRDALINPPVHTASCFRKKDWQEGGIYDPKLRGFEDWDHWLRIMKIRPLVRVIPEFLFNYYVRSGSKVETSNRNSFELTSRIIENHEDLYQRYFSYVIAKKQEIFALNVNEMRAKELELESVVNLLRQKNEEIELIKNSKFWKLREFYLTIKHWLIFVFLNPRKFIKNLFYQPPKPLQKVEVDKKIEKRGDEIKDFKDEIAVIKQFSESNNKPSVRINKRKLSVVMLSLNRLEDTKKSIKALYENINFPFEFIILDNGSDDDVVESLKKLAEQKSNIKLVLEKENLGCAGGRNKAFSLATGDYILSVDNDIIITKYAVENLIETLENNKEVVGACCKTVFPDGSIQFNGGDSTVKGKFIKFSLTDRGKKYNDDTTFEQTTCDWIPGGATMWKSFIIKEVDIDPKMKGSFEDNDYSVMLKKKGFALSNCPKAIVIHNHINFNKKAKEDKKYIESRYNQERIKAALIRFYQKHGLIIRDCYLSELKLDINDDDALIEYFEKHKT